jgi:hypothetical protein
VQLRPIEIDVEVFRLLESRRASFAQTHNDILREVVGLSPVKAINGAVSMPAEHSGGWSGKGVSLPNGSKLRMSYNGQTYTGEIKQGAWHVGGAIYSSPSAAAGGVARTKRGLPVTLDGWGYWDVQKPDSNRWIRINTLRK